MVIKGTITKEVVEKLRPIDDIFYSKLVEKEGKRNTI